MINENEPHLPCWLVWSTSMDGLVTLEAISLTQWYAESTRRLLLRERGDRLISVKIELSQCNHMFAGDLDQKWWQLYGEQAAIRVENTRVDIVKKQLEIARKLGSAMLKAIKSENDNAIRKAALDWILWDK